MYQIYSLIRRSIFCFLKDWNYEAYSGLSDEITWTSEWGGVIFFSHWSTHSKDVCILMNPSLNCVFDNFQKDQNRRISSVDLSLSGSKFSLSNIYVPNDQRTSSVCFSCPVHNGLLWQDFTLVFRFLRPASWYSLSPAKGSLPCI